MTYTPEEERALADYAADLDWAISKKDWKKAAEIIFAVEENGFVHEAKMMSGSLQRAYARESNLQDDLADGPYDADNYRPEYPHE